MVRGGGKVKACHPVGKKRLIPRGRLRYEVWGTWIGILQSKAPPSITCARVEEWLLKSKTATVFTT